MILRNECGRRPGTRHGGLECRRRRLDSTVRSERAKPLEFRKAVSPRAASIVARSETIRVLSPENNEPKLALELVPSSCWFSNLRDELPQEQWDTLRRLTYKRGGYKCEVCGQTDVAFHCHEVWQYNDVDHIQSLQRLACLCPDCHGTKHLGFPRINGRDEECLQRLMRLNNWTRETADSYIEKQFEVWVLRSRREWQLDITLLSDYGIDDMAVVIDARARKAATSAEVDRSVDFEEDLEAWLGAPDDDWPFASNDWETPSFAETVFQDVRSRQETKPTPALMPPQKRPPAPRRRGLRERTYCLPWPRPTTVAMAVALTAVVLIRDGQSLDKIQAASLQPLKIVVVAFVALHFLRKLLSLTPPRSNAATADVQRYAPRIASFPRWVRYGEYRHWWSGSNWTGDMRPTSTFGSWRQDPEGPGVRWWTGSHWSHRTVLQPQWKRRTPWAVSTLVWVTNHVEDRLHRPVPGRWVRPSDRNNRGMIVGIDYSSRDRPVKVRFRNMKNGRSATVRVQPRRTSHTSPLAHHQVVAKRCVQLGLPRVNYSAGRLH